MNYSKADSLFSVANWRRTKAGLKLEWSQGTSFICQNYHKCPYDFFFYTHCVIEAIFNRSNLRLSQKPDLLDTFLNELCTSLLHFFHAFLVNKVPLL